MRTQDPTTAEPWNNNNNNNNDDMFETQGEGGFECKRWKDKERELAREKREDARERDGERRREERGKGGIDTLCAKLHVGSVVP